jgi:hypothetical protein
MEAIVTPVDGADNAPKRGVRSTPGPPIQPARELAPNKSKQTQVKPRKKACISLFFLGGIGPFQRVAGEKNKKNSLRLRSRRRLWATRLKFDLPCPSLTARRAAPSNSLSGNGIAQILFLVKQ